MVESAEPHENPPDDTGRTEPSSQTQVILRHGGDVLQLEFQAVDVGRLTPPRLLLGASTSVGDGGQLTPPRQKKRAVGKKLTPKKKSVWQYLCACGQTVSFKLCVWLGPKTMCVNFFCKTQENNMFCFQLSMFMFMFSRKLGFLFTGIVGVLFMWRMFKQHVGVLFSVNFFSKNSMSSMSSLVTQGENINIKWLFGQTACPVFVQTAILFCQFGHGCLDMLFGQFGCVTGHGCLVSLDSMAVWTWIWLCNWPSFSRLFGQFGQHASLVVWKNWQNMAVWTRMFQLNGKFEQLDQTGKSKLANHWSWMAVWTWMFLSNWNNSALMSFHNNSLN
jgi:hypothetical protein